MKLFPGNVVRNNGSGIRAGARGVWASVAVCSLLLLACVSIVNGQSAPIHYSEGEQIEVREGDTWSAATVVKQEGRKYLIHYAGADASADEWVTTERMRLPGAAAPPAIPAPAAPKKIFAIGTTVEVKSGPWWKKAVVVNHRGEWILVDIDGKQFWRQWVEPWRARAVGSSDDIEGWAKDNPWVHHNEDPPQPAPAPAPAQAHEQPGGMRPVGAPEGQERQLRNLGVLPPLTSLSPDSLPAPKTIAGPIRLQNSAGSPQAIVISSDSGIAAVLYRTQQFGNDAPQSSTVERLDLTAGRSLNISPLPINADLLDLSPDGKLLLTRTNLFGLEGRGEQLDVWDLSGASPVRVTSFVPFPERNGSAKFIEWGRFTDAGHIVAAGKGIVCFEFRTQQVAWAVDAGFFISHYALSPSRKYLAVPSGFGVSVLDTRTGDGIGKIDMDLRLVGNMCFEPDGRELMAAGMDSLAVINLADCSIATEVWTLNGTPQEVAWAADGYLLLNNSQLVSIAKGAIVWTYAGVSGSQGAVLNGRLYYVSDRNRNGQHSGPVVASVELPDKSVADELTIVGNPRMLLKPGMSVSLDVKVDGSIQQPVIDGLTARLKADDLSIADNQPIKVIAKDEPGKTRDVVYNPMGPGLGRRVDKFSVQEIRHTLKIVGPDGKTLWINSALSAPPVFLSMRPGESAQQAVARIMKPNALFYTNVRLPKYIPKPGGGFGTTQLDASGPHPQ